MNKLKIFATALVVFTIFLSSFSFYIYQLIYAPNFLIDKEPHFVYVYSDDSFEEFRDRLYHEKIVNNSMAFSLMAKWLKYDKNIKPGKYLIESNENNLAVIRRLRSGDQVPVRITFNNVRLLDELSEKICRGLEIQAEAFDSILLDPATPLRFGFTRETFKAMFIPNTYEVFWNISAEQLLNRMHKEYLGFWTDERKKKAEMLSLSPEEVVTLASIVESETRYFEESPVIAGLYLNRLKKGMPLQADPTVVYAVGDFNIKRVLNKDKEIDSPYNTYKYAGLPPGPIRMADIRAIDAVLNYDKNDYLYMCAKEDFSGYHNFAVSYAEHQRNAIRYQRALNAAKLYR
ncbi:MAG: endolytic transglycosylase MltG [Cyclobacteriaceae bacterium]|nr:endolytic transglycosylase MltG [Cyclobacteriaceae bacterium]